MTRPPRLRVLHVTAYWPNAKHPTDAIFVREHVRAAALFADVKVAYVAREPAARGLVDVVSQGDPDLDVLSIRYRRLGRPFSYIALVLGLFRAYRALAREGFAPDVIHAHQLVSVLPALLLRMRYRVPVVYTEHWTIFLPENPFRLSRLARAAARVAIARSDLVLPVSRAWQRAVENAGMEGRFRVVPNVADTELFRPAGRRSRNDGVLSLLSVGHMNEGAKGIDILLRALARLRTRGREVELQLVGDGDARAEYEALARELGVADAVRFLGPVSKKRVAELMHEADLFVLASRFENSPCVLAEAAAAGLPSVATNVGGVAELVTPAVGVLAAPGDPDALAEAIERGAASLTEFDADAMARRARERFSLEAVGRELADVYLHISRMRTSA